MATLTFVALFIAAVTGGFSLGVWFATSDDPTKQNNTEWDESMCANCPYRPYGNDETMLH